MIGEAWYVQGVRDKLLDPQTRRHEFKSSHGFRSFFETKCQKARVNHNVIKILMDHSFGESQNYHRPDEDELLEEYLAAIPLITIGEEERLKLKLQEVVNVDKARWESAKEEMDKLRQEVAAIKKKRK